MKKELKEIKKMIAEGNTDIDLYITAGWLSQQFEKFKEAEEYYLQALRLEPENETALHRYCEVLSKQPDKLGLAENVVIELLHKNFEYGCYHGLYADILSETGRINDAANEYRIAIELSPEEDVYINNYGVLLLNNGYEQESKQYFVRAIELDPKYKIYRENLALAIKSTNKFYSFVWKCQKFITKYNLGGWLCLFVILFPKIAKFIVKTQPQLIPIIVPLIFIFVGFALYLWISDGILGILIKLKWIK